MKKRVINCSWPAYLSDFSKDAIQENFSRGKLKVFYKGETADHRYFSEAFSQELIKSLPYTPVVSYYDEEKEDFVGHATEQQVLGIVDPCIAPSFEKDDNGIEWCICDVVLYTERPDKVGDLAKKIVGHKQSLELDPNTVKYVINYDERMHFKNVEFTAGKFVGVSVLGNDQKPAFAGSEFFTYNDQIESKMKILREYCEAKHDQLVGGNEMNLKEFMKLSWGDVSLKVEELICKEYCNEWFTSIVDMYEDSAIVRFYSYEGCTSKLMRIKYSVDENGNVTLGDINEVHVTYEDVNVSTIEKTGVSQTTETMTTSGTDEFAGCGDRKEKREDIDEDDDDDPDNEEPYEDDKEEDDEDMVCGDPKKKKDNMVCNPEKKKEDEMVCDPEKKKDDMVCDPNKKKEDEMSCGDPKKKEDEMVCGGGEKKKKSQCEVVDANTAQVTNAKVIETTKKVSVDDEQIEKENSGATSFTESERAELNSLKREKKVNLLKSYKEYLTSEEYGDFESRIDTFEVDTLEMELLKKYKAHKEEEPEHTMRAFALFTPEKENARNILDDFVRKNLGR